jgi:hypothetical protein
MNNFSYWKLVRAQWSWKNDKIGMCISLGISLFILSVYLLYGVVSITAESYLYYLIGFVYFWLYILLVIEVIYHTIKLLLLGSYCIAVTYIARNSTNTETKLKAITQYNEMLTWRQ